MRTIYVTASRDTLVRMAAKLQTSALGNGSVEVEVMTLDSFTGDDVRLVFLNDDMEERPDLKPETILTEVEED